MTGWCRSDEGFSLLELAITLWLTVIAIGVAVPAWHHLANRDALSTTTQSLLWTLREEQTWAVAQASNTIVDLHPYQPAYDVYHQGKLLSRRAFVPPVDYVDGYLQMPSHRVGYGPGGVSNSMGVITVTDGTERESIHLFRGGGLQTLGGVAS